MWKFKEREIPFKDIDAVVFSVYGQEELQVLVHMKDGTFFSGIFSNCEEGQIAVMCARMSTELIEGKGAPSYSTGSVGWQQGDDQNLGGTDEQNP